jgi:hypothetical protein
MTIQIKNKYLKRLLKKTGVFSKKTGGSSNDIKNIIKGGGNCDIKLQTMLIDRANFLFKKVLITKANDKLFDNMSIFSSQPSTSGSFGSVISFRSFGSRSSQEIKSSIDELLSLIDNGDFTENSAISQAVPPRVIKRKKNIRVGESEQQIVLKYYNFDSNDDDPNAIYTGVINWKIGDVENVFKGRYKMNDGEPFFISGTLIRNNEEPIYILNHIAIDKELQ